MRSISSKILLFGEYLILTGGDALTIPLHKYSGELSYQRENRSADYVEESAKHLREFLALIEQKNEQLKHSVDIEEFKLQLENGVYFDSTIPMKSGLGSSGAVCAAVYNEYAFPVEKYRPSDLTDVCDDLKILESFFHGKSSGLDPLTCYLDKPLYVNNSKVYPLNMGESNLDLFLLDTRIQSATAMGVKRFKELLDDPSFFNLVQCQLIPTSNSLISAYRRNKKGEFYSAFNKFIEEQLQYFPEIIPEKYRQFIHDGIEKDIFRMKICGSGGGGFLLGFTDDIYATKQYFEERKENIILI